MDSLTSTESPDGCYTVAEIAALLAEQRGAPVTEEAARKAMSRAGIAGTMHYSAAEVDAALASRPGRGARTDIRRKSEDAAEER